MKLRLENGKFYRGSEEVPVEIGNLEQIELLKEQNKYAVQFAGKGLQANVDISVTAYSKFKCVCGKHLYFEVVECNTNDEAEEELHLQKQDCVGCGRKYIISFDEDEYQWYIKERRV